jgi:hypothetical protein
MKRISSFILYRNMKETERSPHIQLRHTAIVMGLKMGETKNETS